MSFDTLIVLHLLPPTFILSVSCQIQEETDITLFTLYTGRCHIDNWHALKLKIFIQHLRQSRDCDFLTRVIFKVKVSISKLKIGRKKIRFLLDQMTD